VPSAEASLYAILTQGSPNPVSAIVGSRVYPNVLPQNVSYPCVRYSRISTPRSEWRTLDGTANYATPRFQLDAYALKHSDALNLSQAIYRHLEGFRGTVSGLRIDAVSTEDEAGEYEPGVAPGDVGVHRQRLDFVLMHAE
jgi:Protein of unknown function (DUF3168)